MDTDMNKDKEAAIKESILLLASRCWKAVESHDQPHLRGIMYRN